MNARSHIDQTVERSLDAAELQGLKTRCALLQKQVNEAGSKLLDRAEQIRELKSKLAIAERVENDLHTALKISEDMIETLRGQVEQLRNGPPDAVYERARMSEEECTKLRKVVEAQDRLIRYRGERIAELTADPKEWR